MSLIRINKNPSGRQLLVFSLAWLALLGLSGWRSWLRGRLPAAEALWILAAVIPLSGMLSRRPVRWIYLALSYATYPIGFAVSRVVLALVYYLALAPIGLTMRLFGYDPLFRRFDPAARSYWTDRIAARPTESYFQQY